MPHRPLSPSVYRLERLLGTEATRQELGTALAEAESSQETIPPLLHFRVKERIDAERMVERRRMMFGIGIVVLFFGTIVGGFGLTTLQQSRSLMRSETNLQSLIENEQWDEATVFINSLDEATRNQPEIVEAIQAVDQAKRDEEERKRNFKKLVDQLNSEPESQWDLDSVGLLQSLARSEEEIATAAGFHELAEEQRLKREAAKADSQTAEFDALSEEVNRFLKIEKSKLSRDAALARQLELREKLNRFISNHSLSNPELTDTAKQIVELLSQEAAEDVQRMDRDALIDSATQAIGDQQAFLAAIDELVENYPDEAVAIELSDSQQWREIIDATLTWKRVLDHESFRKPAGVDAAHAKTWLEAFDAAREKRKTHPLAESAMPWRDHYVAIAKRGEQIRRLKLAYRDKLFQDMYVYPDTAGQRFYSGQAPKKESRTGHVVPVFVDVNLRTETKNFGLRYPAEIEPHVRKAGHSVFRGDTQDTVGSITETEFTPALFRIIKQLRDFQSDPEFDPIYRLTWMKRLLDIGCLGSKPIDDAFADWRDALESATVNDSANWISFQADEADQQANRDRARDALNDLSDFEKKVEIMTASYKAFRSQRDPTPRWVGWIAKQGNRHVALVNSDTASMKTYVLTANAGDEQLSLVEITIDDSANVVPITNPAAQFSGAMILAFATTPTE